MLKTERPLPQASATIKRPERVAWAVLLSSFSIFCMLCVSTGLYAYRWWTQPTPGVVAATVQQKLFVQRLPAGRIQPVVFQGGELFPDDRVLISAEAPPGPASTLSFGTASLALWAGTDLRIGQLRQQSNPHAVAPPQFELDSGQILVDFEGSGETLTIDIGGNVGGAPIQLTSPGRYRIRLLDQNSPTTAEAERSLAPGLEVAVERGTARVGDTQVAAGERLIEADNRQDPRRNRWDLVRDGNFQQLVNTVLYRETGQPSPWQRSSDPTVVGAAITGGPIPTQACTDPVTHSGCEEPYLRLVRRGGNTKGFVTAVKQQIDADVTSYRWVRLKADISIVYQSLSKAGEAGTECPLLIEIVYTNTEAANVHKDYCYWAFEYPNQNGVVAHAPYIETTQVPQNTWVPINIELKQQLEQLVKIESISFQANGHDYESQVRNVELFGEGLVEVPKSQ